MASLLLSMGPLLPLSSLRASQAICLGGKVQALHAATEQLSSVKEMRTPVVRMAESWIICGRKVKPNSPMGRGGMSHTAGPIGKRAEV
jgi:hypothetical protein